MPITPTHRVSPVIFHDVFTWSHSVIPQCVRIAWTPDRENVIINSLTVYTHTPQTKPSWLAQSIILKKVPSHSHSTTRSHSRLAQLIYMEWHTKVNRQIYLLEGLKIQPYAWCIVIVIFDIILPHTPPLYAFSPTSLHIYY